FDTVMKFHSMLGEDVPNVKQILGCEALVRKRFRRSAEDLRKIDNRVASDGKSELRLFFASTVDADHHQGAGVQDGGERSDPGLVVVLGTKIRQHRIGEMAF